MLTDFWWKKAMLKRQSTNKLNYIQKGRLMKNLPVLLISAVATLATVGGVMASSSSGTCNYREDGKYVMSDGTVSAFGTMNHAMHCASLGLLPDAVSRRLGWLGDDETIAWAEDIKRLNQEVIERQKEEKKEEVLIEILEDSERI
jgi:hypothetical protein